MDYNTKQRQTILDFLMKSNSHVTAAEIEKHLSDCGKKVGTATIYRYLNKLLAEGLVRKFSSVDGACYQYIGNGKCHTHYHFVCQSCNKLIHVECSALDTLSSHFFEKHGFKVDMGKTVFCGECSQCSEKRNM